MPHNFAFGDQIRNTARPEWGVGTIVRLEPGGFVVEDWVGVVFVTGAAVRVSLLHVSLSLLGCV